ncbi:unnamed protein product [Polarella glacialis]|uniref:Major facilitator superfamily (MFS) profile domain-containing protein n=2 Tax=Polarella glacialis TaxID=89957 RepID=A0A813K0Q4_POLGL|nr:unnamed protein product [Polarella glacialis]
MEDKARKDTAKKETRRSSTSPKPKGKLSGAHAAEDGKDASPEKEKGIAEKVSQFRWVMCCLLFGCRLVCQANRILLGALLPIIRKDVGFSDQEAGQLLAAFASGYMLTQILGGALADRLGGKWILQLAINAVSIGSLAAPFAIDQGFWPAYWTYFLMGLLEGPSFPTAGSMLSKWIPATERATASSLADTGGSVGGLLALGGGPILATMVGWRSTFMVYGACSVVFCAVWLLFSASRPTGCRWVSQAELAMLIKEGVVEQQPVQAADVDGKEVLAAASLNKVLAEAVDPDATSKKPSKTKSEDGFPWRMFLSAPVLAVCYAHSVFNFGRYFLYGWIPTYYSEVLGVDAVTAGFYMMCLQVADAFVKLLVAPIADHLTSSGKLSILGLRRLLSCAGFLGFGGGLLLCCFAPNAFFVTVALVIGKSFASCHAAGFKTNYLDITRKHTGSVAGVGNTLATLSSTVAPMIAGSIIQASGWNAVFVLCFFVNVSGAVVFGLFSSASCIDPVVRED